MWGKTQDGPKYFDSIRMRFKRMSLYLDVLNLEFLLLHPKDATDATKRQKGILFCYLNTKFLFFYSLLVYIVTREIQPLSHYDIIHLKPRIFAPVLSCITLQERRYF